MIGVELLPLENPPPLKNRKTKYNTTQPTKIYPIMARIPEAPLKSLNMEDTPAFFSAALWVISATADCTVWVCINWDNELYTKVWDKREIAESFVKVTVEFVIFPTFKVMV